MKIKEPNFLYFFPHCLTFSQSAARRSGYPFILKLCSIEKGSIRVISIYILRIQAEKDFPHRTHEGTLRLQIAESAVCHLFGIDKVLL